MVNKKGGKKYKRGRKRGPATAGNLVYKDEHEEYAKVIKTLGDRGMEVFCADKQTKIVKVKGAMRKRVWVNVGDLVLIVQDCNVVGFDGMIVHKYTKQEMRKLIKQDEIPKNFETIGQIGGDEEDEDSDVSDIFSDGELDDEEIIDMDENDDNADAFQKGVKEAKLKEEELKKYQDEEGNINPDLI